MLTAESTQRLGQYQIEPGKNSISGLSSGAFMTVQLHLAHSSRFCGAGIVAGGPYRCAESFLCRGLSGCRRLRAKRN